MKKSKKPIIRLITIQEWLILLSSIGLGLGWLAAIITELNYNGDIGYLTDHLEQWTAHLPIWGGLFMVCGIIAVAVLRWIETRPYLATIVMSGDYLVIFVVNMIIGNTWIVHVILGVLIGWIVLFPWAIYIHSIYLKTT